MTHKILTTDIVIIGAGGAGLMAAIQAAQAGHKVICLSKVPPMQSHTASAKGGMNAALGIYEEDHTDWHAYDTIKGGDYLSDHDVVLKMCAEAPHTIELLKEMGMPFQRHDTQIAQRIYGGQTGNFGTTKPPPRACYVADRTGYALLNTLYQNALKHSISFLEHHLAFRLLYEDKQCFGVSCVNLEHGEIHHIHATHTIIATGGYGALYQHTTSASSCTGDGIALAAYEGLALRDMEFMQFHPTSLYGTNLLISEAARSNGAYLINSKGERFMERYAPDYKDLAARDVIARAMATEMAEGRGMGENKDHLGLVATHIGNTIWAEQLPELRSNAKEFAGIDVTKDPVPVVPAAHFSMGGIATNAAMHVLDAKGTAISGLLAIGEAACASIHGANRLGCNALMDIIVTASWACHTIEQEEKVKEKLPPHLCTRNEAHITHHQTAKGTHQPGPLYQEIRRIMECCAGMARSQEDLEEGLAALDAIEKKATSLQSSGTDLRWNETLINTLTLHHGLIIAKTVLTSAKMRRESRGSHYRKDYPERDDTHYLKHSTTDWTNNQLNIRWEEIRKDARSDTLPFSPEKRAY